MAKTSKQFIQDLPKIYGTYTGGFLVFINMMNTKKHWTSVCGFHNFNLCIDWLDL